MYYNDLWPAVGGTYMPWAQAAFVWVGTAPLLGLILHLSLGWDWALVQVAVTNRIQTCTTMTLQTYRHCAVCTSQSLFA